MARPRRTTREIFKLGVQGISTINNTLATNSVCEPFFLPGQTKCCWWSSACRVLIALLMDLLNGLTCPETEDAPTLTVSIYGPLIKGQRQNENTSSRSANFREIPFRSYDSLGGRPTDDGRGFLVPGQKEQQHVNSWSSSSSTTTASRLQVRSRSLGTRSRLVSFSICLHTRVIRTWGPHPAPPLEDTVIRWSWTVRSGIGLQ